MPYLDELYAQSQQEPAQPFSAGRANWTNPGAPASVADQIPGNEYPQPAPRESDWPSRVRAALFSGGATDVRNIAGALGPAIQAAGGLFRGAAAGQRMALPAKMDAADQMFDVTQMAPRMQGGFVDPRVAAGMGAGVGLGGGGLYALYGGSPEEQATAPAQPAPNAGVGVSVPAAARVIKTRADQTEAAVDATVMSYGDFVKKWGMPPEKALGR